MKPVYLILAIVGAIVPMLFFLQFFSAGGAVGQPGFVSALFVNGAAGGFAADLFISSFVFWIYMFNRRAVGPGLWPFVLLNLFIGLSCALPAYLYFNARRSDSGRVNPATA